MVTILAEMHTEPDSNRSRGFRHGNGSAFALEVDGEWHLITAGHVIRDLKSIHATGKLAHLYLCDAWSDSSGIGRPIPLPMDPNRWSIIGDADKLDCGIIQIGSLLAANLQQGQVVAFRESDWNSSPDDFDFYALLGAPGELIVADERSGAPPAAYDVRRAILEVEKTERPTWVTPTPHERFYGRLASTTGVKVSQIEGMSGGPVLACGRQEDGFRCMPVAVQSGWYRDQKVIVADYLTPLVEAIRDRSATTRS
jgi:hypothetical protein